MKLKGIGTLMVALLIVGVTIWGNWEPEKNPLRAAPPAHSSLPGTADKPELSLQREEGTTDSQAQSLIDGNAPPTRAPSLSLASIRLQSTSGELANGRVVLIHDRKELREGIAMQTYLGESLWENISDVDGQTSSGQLDFDPNLLSIHSETLVMVFAPGFAPFIQSLGKAPTFPLQLTLTPVAPITVTVADPSGNPIAGAVVAARADYTGTFNATNTLKEQLNWLFFQSVLHSDGDGIAVIQTVLAETNNLIAQPKNGFASVSLDGVSPGTHITLTCDVAFQIHGRILDPQGKPLANARAKAYSDLGSDAVFVGSAHADEQGLFTIERLPASQTAIRVHASMESMETASWLITQPSLNTDYEHDFTLYPGVSGSITLLTQTGEPISNAYVTFSRSNVDFVPGYYQTNDQGLIELKPSFRKDYPYSVTVTLGNQKIRLAETYIAGTDSTLTMPNLGKITSWEIPIEISQSRTPSYCMWNSYDSSRQGDFWWASSEPSPWVPAGAGVFTIQFEDESRVEQEYVLEPNPNGQVLFTGSSTTLRLTIPAGQVAEVQLYASTDAFLLGLNEVSGSISIPCKPGLFGLNILMGDLQIILNEVRVPPEGLDLGEVHLPQDASLMVHMESASGNPLPDCYVSVVTSTGILVAEGWSDSQGQTEFEALPPAPYFIYASSENAYFTEGREFLTSVQVLPAQRKEITLAMGSAEGTVEVSIDRTGLPMPQGFFIDSVQRVNYHLPSNGMATLPASSHSGYLGVTANSTGYALIAGKEIPAGPGRYQLHRNNLRETELHFVDENGFSAGSLKIGLYLSGQHLPYRPYTNPDGTMLIEWSFGLPLEMEVWTNGGTPLRFPLHQLTSGQQVVIPKSLPTKSISFHNSEGRLIPGLQVIGVGFMESIYSKRDGTVDVPLFLNRLYHAQASGFFPVIFDPNAISELTLPRALDHIVILDLPENANRVYIESLLPIASPLPLRFWVSNRANGRWQPGTIPAGPVKVTAYDANDALVGEYSLVLNVNQNDYSILE